MPRFPWSLSAIASKTGSSELSPEDVVHACSSAVHALEPQVRAWSWLGLDDARDRARALTAGARDEQRRPLLGVPYAAKDIFDTAGIPTEWGTETQRGRVPADDCDLVARLDALGAVLVGKTHTTAYAYFDPGPTRNPLDPAHTPGGSSSGSAAAVAAGMVPLAIGSQTQGSVLRPASFCGIAGFKPSFGRLPLGGVMAFAPTLDHAGLFAQTAEDIRTAWRALGFDPGDAPERSVTVLDWPPGRSIDTRMAETLRTTLQSLSAGGMRVTEVARPKFFDTLPGAARTVMAYEAAREHGERYRAFGGRMGAKLSALLREGQKVRERQYGAALGALQEAREQYSEWAARHRVAATPAAPGPAPAGLGSTGDPICNLPFTALGVPAVAIPMPVPAGRLPMGLQLASAAGQDGRLLATAALCESLLRRST